MRYDTLAAIEERFQAEAASALKDFALEVPGEDLILRGKAYTPKSTGYYYSTEHPKQRIVLHFTAGNLRSDIQSLTRPNVHISVSFVIARDGTIYLLFPPRYWSGHLGEGVGNKKGTGNPQDKATIGIELSNYGYLVPANGNLETIYSRVKDPKTGQTSPVDLYCAQDNHEAYNRIDLPFREQTFFPSYTSAQVDSLIILLRFLTAKYNIPRQFLPEDKRFIAFNDVVNFKGIVSHVNYRSGGKWDIGPSFDWGALIQGVTAPAYQSTQPVPRSLANIITTEEELKYLYPRSRDVSDAEAETTDNEGYNPNAYEGRSLDI